MSPGFDRLKTLVALIPWEILIEIFKQLVDPRNRAHPHSLEVESKALRSAMRVCSTWYQIITNSPFLLARVIDMDRDPPSRVSYLLERSAGHPISIIGGWTSSPWIIYRQESNLNFHERRENIQLVFRSFHRCDYLHVRISENHVWDTPELGRILSEPSPTIRHFTFLWPSQITLQPATSILRPSCETIQVSGDIICNSTRIPCSLPPLPNLTTLAVHANCAQARSSPRFSPPSAFTPHTWLSRLSQLPNLVNLTIYDMFAQGFSDEPTGPVKLDRLESLKVYGSAPECFEFLVGLEVVSLKRCTVECNVLAMGSTPAGLQRFGEGMRVVLAKLPWEVNYSQLTVGYYEKELRLCGGLESGDELIMVVCREDVRDHRMFTDYEYLELWTQALDVFASDLTWPSLLSRVETLKLRSGVLALVRVRVKSYIFLE